MPIFADTGKYKLVRAISFSEDLSVAGLVRSHLVEKYPWPFRGHSSEVNAALVLQDGKSQIACAGKLVWKFFFCVHIQNVGSNFVFSALLYVICNDFAVQSAIGQAHAGGVRGAHGQRVDRKSTRLNSS